MTSESEYRERLPSLPCWRGPVRSTRMRGGLSNITFKVEDDSGPYVARWGADIPVHQVNRQREHLIARAAASLGISPSVRYSEQDVIVLDYIDGRVFCAEDSQNAAARLGALLAKFHVELPPLLGDIRHRFNVFDTIRGYYAKLIEAKCEAATTLQPYLELVPTLEAAHIQLPDVLAHNDLLPANFLEDERQIWLIDWEYAGYGSPFFDLGGLSSNGNFSDEQDDILLEAYFSRGPSDPLRRSLGAMKVANNLRETLWGLISERYLRTEGIDYQAYWRECQGRLELSVAAMRERSNLSGLG